MEDLETEPKAVGMPMQKSDGLATFNLFQEGKMIKVTLPDRGEAQFGASFAHHKNLLLVGSPSGTEERGAGFLFMRRNVANAFVQNGFLVTVLPIHYRLGYHEIHIQELVWN